MQSSKECTRPVVMMMNYLLLMDFWKVLENECSVAGCDGEDELQSCVRRQQEEGCSAPSGLEGSSSSEE